MNKFSGNRKSKLTGLLIGVISRAICSTSNWNEIEPLIVANERSCWENWVTPRVYHNVCGLVTLLKLLVLRRILWNGHFSFFHPLLFSQGILPADSNGTKITWLIVKESPRKSTDFKGFSASNRCLNLVPFWTAPFDALSSFINQGSWIINTNRTLRI